MDLRELVERHREAILDAAQRHKAGRVRLFGSVVRGEADDASDIDILVEFRDGASLLDHAGLMLELQKLLGRQVDVVSDRALRPRIKERVLREAEPL